MILRRTLNILLVLISAILIQACGNAADSSDKIEKGRTPGGGSDGNSNNGFAVEVMVKGTAGLAGEDAILDSQPNSLLPGLAGQSTLEVDEIKVIRLGSNGQERDDLPVPSYVVKSDHFNGIHTINFTNRYESRIDLAIEATLPGGTTLRRPLPNTTRTGPTNNKVPHSVNVATEYAMRSFFDYVEQDHRERFDQLLNCPQLALECRTQAATALANLLALSEGTSDFEISIPEEYDLEEAIDYLESHLDLRRFVEKSSKSVLAKTLGGQTSDGEIPDVLDSVVGNYNGVSYALELNQGLQQPEQPTAILRNWSSSFSEVQTDSKITYQAPSLTVANMGFNIISSLLVGAVPSVHQTLALTDSAPEITSSPEGERNLIDQTNTYAGYTLQGTYDYGLLQHQSLTGEKKASTETIGWLNNPYFNSLYDATAQGALLTARVTTGLAFRLSGAQAPYKREELREKLNRFTFSAYSKRADVSQTDSSKGFDPARLQGKRYGVVMLTQKFNESGDPVTAAGSIRHWEMDLSGFELEDTQPVPTASDLDIFRSWTPSYDGSGLADSQNSTPIERGYEALLSRLTQDNTAYSARTGLLKLTTGTESWEGISDPNGELLSFAINTASDGQGIAHAIPLLTDVGLSAPGNGDTFRLMGNGIGFTSNENYLYHVDDSSLKFYSGNQVELTLKKIKVRQDRASLEVSSLEETATETLTTTAIYGAGDIKNSIQMTFTDDAGNAIALEGFITQRDADNPEAGGRIMVLLMRHENSIGLVYAVLEKELSQQ